MKNSNGGGDILGNKFKKKWGKEVGRLINGY